MIEKYEQFNEIENPALRARNRAIVMSNIWEDHNQKNEITKQGAALLFQYFKELPKVDIALTFEAFKADMAERGYVYGG